MLKKQYLLQFCLTVQNKPEDFGFTVILPWNGLEAAQRRPLRGDWVGLACLWRSPRRQIAYIPPAEITKMISI